MRKRIALTEAQEAKVFENMEKIVEHIRALQPGIIGDIVATWGRDRYGLYVTRSAIVGESPMNKRIALDGADEGLGPRVPVHKDLDFAVSLIVNWTDVKIELENEIEDQRWTIEAIENFEV